MCRARGRAARWAWCEINNSAAAAINVMRVGSVTLCDPIIQNILIIRILKDAEKWILNNNILANFDKAAKLCKSNFDAYNCGGWLILQDLLNERVA